MTFGYRPTTEVLIETAGANCRIAATGSTSAGLLLLCLLLGSLFSGLLGRLLCCLFGCLLGGCLRRSLLLSGCLLVSGFYRAVAAGVAGLAAIAASNCLYRKIVS